MIRGFYFQQGDGVSIWQLDGAELTGGLDEFLGGGEWLRGAGEFNDLLDLPTEVWETPRPSPKPETKP